MKQAMISLWMVVFARRGEYKNLWTQTAMVRPKALAVNVCADLIRCIDNLANDSKNGLIWRDAALSDTRIHRFEDHIPNYLVAFDVERHIAAIDAYLGSRTKSWFLMANRVLPKENNLGSGGGLHRDSPFSHQVKCIWYLNDVSANNGPFRYAAGTNSNVMKMRKTYPLGNYRFDAIEDNLIEVHAKAGSLLICDTKCIHGGKPIKSGARYAVTLYTFHKEGGAIEFLEKFKQ